jgi:hypothetical protein
LLNDQCDNPRSDEIIKKLDFRIGFDIFENIREALHRDMDGFDAFADQHNPDHIKQTGLAHGAPTCLIESRGSEKSRDSHNPTRI